MEGWRDWREGGGGREGGSVGGGGKAYIQLRAGQGEGARGKGGRAGTGIANRRRQRRCFVCLNAGLAQRLHTSVLLEHKHPMAKG